ncbi:T9SS C-terminal target domain-containing protein [Dyadobacter chenwenxiniae]|uniref:T9SS C-terminal target domain-containing protein n=1 Tax=Dyadobacter chenwenxiniae TaxID=2906456 RepID=A0A9X1PLH1_9BACT|nr:T9SS C-terminal target domain-containing protein [Dyadobacter chenwenxiniae]MCF0049204.1 T9SS C-terminal target domain-containing protein [Dyadobacter chenwenxiniae]MCF0061713.1 T9SS C-terminal target domain-containing protein [Dyadobacter chenwenxiniae]UON81531.1 T9SS C-terminal target domain-containing protein [Dyadobacter chenwenxiniae]
MKNLGKLFNILMIGLLLTGFSACNDDDPDPVVEPPVANEIVKVSGSITANTNWTADKQYLITGFVYVKSGATLTIAPGTIIKGDKDSKGALFIERGGKIMAVGTATQPIIFTSNQAAGQRKAGDWGGLVILGKAPVNKTPAVVEGEELTEFGGTEVADNSGELKYVRIEFAGIAYASNKEINSLTMGGVGSGTKIEYVQCSYGGDDSFEWFGGAVNAKHLISYRGLDDDFDTDNGFSGLVQYGLILRDPAIADQAGDSNGFESDNDANGTATLPQTTAKFANITVAMAAGEPDGKFASGARIRRNSAISIYNSVFTGSWPRSGVRVEAASLPNFTSGLLKLDGVHVALSGTQSNGAVEGLTTAQFATGAKNSVATIASLLLPDGYNSITAKPGVLPKAGSPLLTGGATLPAGFEATTYAGAFSTTDWTEGWANFDPQNADYTLKK